MESSTVALEHEHRIVQKVIAGMAMLADELQEGKPVKSQLLKEIVEFLRGFVDQCHHAKEDKYLFPLLEQRGVPGGGCPLGALKKEHEKGRLLVKQFTEAVDPYADSGGTVKDPLIQALRDLVELYPGHIWKEDYLLFPLAAKVLSPADHETLSKQFEEVELEFGPDAHSRFERLALKLAHAVQPGPQRLSEPIAGPSLAFDLAAQIQSLRREEGWTSGRNSKTIVKHPDLRLVLTVMKANTSIHEHSAAGSTSVQTISGHIRMRVAGQEFDLPTGHLLALDAAVPHDVEALEDSAFLLTVAWRAAAAQ
jgi:hemerythrin-like domain-containing protein/quercetin dioxygenase-like cupin family protein